MNVEDWNIILGVLEVAEENAAHRLEEEKQSRLAAVRAVRIEHLGNELMRIRRAIRKVQAAIAFEGAKVPKGQCDV